MCVCVFVCITSVSFMCQMYLFLLQIQDKNRMTCCTSLPADIWQTADMWNIALISVFMQLNHFPPIGVAKAFFRSMFLVLRLSVS